MELLGGTRVRVRPRRDTAHSNGDSWWKGLKGPNSLSENPFRRISLSGRKFRYFKSRSNSNTRRDEPVVVVETTWSNRVYPTGDTLRRYRTWETASRRPEIPRRPDDVWMTGPDGRSTAVRPTKGRPARHPLFKTVRPLAGNVGGRCAAGEGRRFDACSARSKVVRAPAELLPSACRGPAELPPSACRAPAERLPSSS